MATYEPTLQDVQEWTNQSSTGEEQQIDLQEQADRQQERSIRRAQDNLQARQTTRGMLDHIDADDHKLYQLSEARNAAEAKGDWHEMQRIEAVLDGLVAGSISTSSTEAKKPRAAIKREDQVTSTSQTPDTFEGYGETASDINDHFGGPDKVNQIIEFANTYASEEDKKVILQSMESGNVDDVVTALSVQQVRMNQQSRGVKTGQAGFNDAEGSQLTERYGSRASEIVDMSNAVRDGRMTASAAVAAAMKDPQLMVLAQRMVQDGAVQLN